MRKAVPGAMLGLLAGMPALALAYLGAQAGSLAFVPFDVFTWLARVLPGPLITAAIEALVSALQLARLGPTAGVAKAIEAGLAVALVLLMMTLLGGVYSGVTPRFGPRAASCGAAAGFALWLAFLPAAIQSGWTINDHVWVLLISLAWGLSLSRALGRWQRFAAPPPDPARREFIRHVGAGALAVTVISWGLGWLFARRESAQTAARPEGVPPPPTPNRPETFEPVPGMRAELTPVPDFYRVDIRLDPPGIDPETWRLRIGGLVDQPAELSYAHLLGLPAQDFYATLECISNDVGGDLISTSWFTGVPLHVVLSRVGVQPGAADIKFTCADGYTESLPVEAALRPGSYLCLGMGGAPLTPGHGFPVRLFTSNRFGMKNPKWITQIEAVAEDYEGFWQRRGWSEPAWVKTTSVIDASQSSGEGRLLVGGIAYAGSRGIQQVELRIDGAEWVTAELRPALSPLSWVLWRAEVRAAPGQHELTVRAVDGEGQLQIETRAKPLPNGATGYHTRRATVEG